jgi:alpha-L-rhamnosidase
MGKTDDQTTFAGIADKLKTAFNQRFYNPATHQYLGDTQCGYVLALQFGLVADDQRDAVIANLVDDIMVKHNGHLPPKSRPWSTAGSFISPSPP